MNSLEKALQSILSQSYQDYEIVVMDGGSTDGTLDIIKRYADQIDYWQSSRDGGTTQAMNIGFAKSTGDLVTFLCSDDQFYNENVFQTIMREFNGYADTEVLCASLEVVDPKGQVPTFRSYSRPDRLHAKMSVHLPGAFFRRGILGDEPFSATSEVANDYELFAALQTVKKARIRVIEDVTVTFSLGGRTNDPSTDFWKARECFAVRLKYYGLWSAVPRLILDCGTATLRKLHFRPYKWGRKIRQVLAGG